MAFDAESDWELPDDLGAGYVSAPLPAWRYLWLDMPSDINTAPLVGLALTEALLERDPNERVLLYANIEGQEYVDRARRVGAAGYLPKREMSLPELQEAIETVAAGGESWPE